MASILDVSVLENFSNIFVFILVMLIVVVLISSSKFLGGNKAIAWIIAIIIGIFVLFSNVAIGSIKFMIPWVVIIIIFGVLITVVMQAFGASPMEAGFGNIKGVVVVVIVLAIIIGLFSYVRDQTLPAPDNETGKITMDYTKTSNIIFHPKVMGSILIFLIAIFTVALLAGKSS